VDGVDLGAQAAPGEPRRRAMDESFPWRGDRTTARNRCHVADVPIQTPAGDGRVTAWTLEVRVFDDGAAFRYRVPGRGPRRVAGESTAWRLPPEATVWFQTSTTSYEEVYRPARAGALPLEETDKKGVKHRVHLGPPATVAYPDGAYGLLTEAALRNYSGLTLRVEGDARLAAAFRDDASGWTHEGELLSPWRVLVLTRDLNGLVNSDVIAALCDPPDPVLFPEGMNTAWIKPGKAICTWIVFGNDGAAWERQKWFVDQCVAVGAEYLLVDGGWQSEQWGWLKGGADPWARLNQLVAYGRERGVGILLWHAYADRRNDGPGLTTAAAREQFFRRCHDAGVAGVKLDFFESESKAQVEVREEILRLAARYRLAVNFHGVNKPTGEPRTWPNEVTREGIREQEYLLWTELPLSHYGALPFTAHGRRARGFPARFCAGALSEKHHRGVSARLDRGLQHAVPLLARTSRSLPAKRRLSARAHGAGDVGRNARAARLGAGRNGFDGTTKGHPVVRGRTQLSPAACHPQLRPVGSAGRLVRHGDDGVSRRGSSDKFPGRRAPHASLRRALFRDRASGRRRTPARQSSPAAAPDEEVAG
jgi:alpha-glucosidase